MASVLCKLKKKNKCPKIEPCRTPTFTSLHDENWPFKTNRWWQFLKKSIKWHNSFSVMLLSLIAILSFEWIWMVLTHVFVLTIFRYFRQCLKCYDLRFSARKVCARILHDVCLENLVLLKPLRYIDMDLLLKSDRKQILL